MSIEWWPALVFGWPGPILAIIFCVFGIVRARVAWLLAAAVLIMPFSLYLGMNPRVQWGVALPLLPLIAAGATSRGNKPIAWLSLLLLTGMILWLASIVFSERVKSRLSIAHVLQSAASSSIMHADGSAVAAPAPRAVWVFLQRCVRPADSSSRRVVFQRGRERNARGAIVLAVKPSSLARASDRGG